MFHNAEIALSDIHRFFSTIIDEVETKGETELKALSADIQTSIANAKTEALKEVATSAPDIQAAVQKALGVLEQAVLAAITVHLA